MSKTSLKAVDILYHFVKGSLLMTDPARPKGTLNKFERPDNSVSEDMVINSLGLNRDDVQNGLLNLNIYVPDIKITMNGVDQYKPDTERLQELSELGNVALDQGHEVWEENGDYVFNIQQDIIFKDTNNQHYVNFRIEFYSINI